MGAFSNVDYELQNNEAAVSNASISAESHGIMCRMS